MKNEILFFRLLKYYGSEIFSSIRCLNQNDIVFRNLPVGLCLRSGILLLELFSFILSTVVLTNIFKTVKPKMKNH